jgi:membrane protein YqaA with SNARE-associated domain
MLHVTYSWIEKKIDSPYASWLLALVFYIEALLFLPVEPLLIMFCLARKDKAVRYGLIATAASVLGGLTSYYIGYFLWNHLGETIIHNRVVAYFIKPETFNRVCALYRDYKWPALLMAGIPPIPFKIATFTAGFCSLPLIPFIICTTLVRGTRFLGLAYCVHRWGLGMVNLIKHWLSSVWFKIAFASLGILFLYFIIILKR